MTSVYDVCLARALPNLSRPNNVNLLVVAGFIVYKKYQYQYILPPIQQNEIFETPYTKKTFSRPTIQKIDIFETHSPKKSSIFETPYTKKLVFSRPPYLTKWHFRDVLYKKLAFSRSPYKSKWPFREPL